MDWISADDHHSIPLWPSSHHNQRLRQPSSSSSSLPNQAHPSRPPSRRTPSYGNGQRTSSSSMSTMRRMRDMRPTMDVKVLYTLESSPQHTMIARMGRPVPIDIVHPVAGPPSPLADIDKASSKSSRPRFGRVTLKACLSAICIASPELIFDPKKDFVIYAVDPEESYRAVHLRSPSGPPRSYNGLTRAASDSVTRTQSEGSSSSKSDASFSAMLVGKGYFSWGLEEEGDGETIVTGRIRSEGIRPVYRDGHVVEEEVSVLEVVLKMKETQARSKDQYFSLVRGFGATSNAASSSSSLSHSRSRPAMHYTPYGSEDRMFREMTLRSEPDYHHRRERPSPIGSLQRPSQRSATPMRDAPSSSSRDDLEKTAPVSRRTKRRASATPPASDKKDDRHTPSPTATAANPQMLQLLSLLRTLQSHQAQPGQQAPAPQQQAQLASLLSLVAGALGADGQASTEASAESSNKQDVEAVLEPIESEMANLPDEGGSPGPASAKQGKENQPSDASEPPSTRRGRGRPSKSTPRADAASPDKVNSKPGDDDTENYISNTFCYNCGFNGKTTWRTLALAAGTKVAFPAGEKPPADVTISEYTPKFSGQTGPILADGVARWSACNPCGLYFCKYLASRPEYVWNRERINEKRKMALKAQKEREGRSSSAKAESHSRKKVKISQTDDEAMSPAYSTSAPTPTNAASKSAPRSGRKSSITRTLSKACNREAERMEAERLEKETGKKKAKSQTNREADREMFQDENGEWRSRRSIRENPLGLKPGRPKGCKAGTKKGRAREAKDTTIPLNEPSPVASTRSSPGPSGLASGTNTTDDDSVFRAPPPSATMTTRQNHASRGRTVSFVQSSPIRPHSGSLTSQVPGHSAPFDSPSRDVRFGVPSYLLDSSPTTMLDTLMSEADFDFQDLGSSGYFGTPGNLLSGSFGTPGSLRRSPRKHPNGTKAAQNPYATQEPVSPSLLQRAYNGIQSLVFSSNASPVTRSRTRSGQGVLHPALFYSSDSPTDGKPKGKSSSNATSPGSPSRKRPAKPAAAGKAKSKASHAKSQLVSPKVTAKKNRASGKASLMRDNDEEDEEEEQLTKGPYQGGSKEGSAELPNCPPSPSLGRISRKLNRVDSCKATGPARLAHLDLPPSSPPVFDHPTTESANMADIEVDGWGRTPSMREIFPTPSDCDWASPEKDTEPTTADKAQPEAPKKKSPEMALIPFPPAHVARRPLPATVEDASSSVSGSSPEDSPEESTNLFELFDDPYGLLAASGFSVNNAGMSVDAFQNVELHHASNFGTHLNQFTQNGGVGVAAHVGTTPAQHPTPIEAAPNNTDFLSNLSNADLTALFASPGKPKLSQQMFETILTSPRKDKDGEQQEGTADLMALLNNPDIQAMLAEFGDNPATTTTAAAVPALTAP